MPPATVEEVSNRLAAFWSAQGCHPVAAYDAGIRATAFAPETYLRLLGPVAVRSCGLQYVRSSSQGRYDRDPLRASRELCYQVLLKPSEPAVDELLIKGLRAAGFELELRDLRLRSEVRRMEEVGLEGAGWLVSLDSVEVARVTFYLALGDLDLAPASVEIVFRVEPLALLQQYSAVPSVQTARGEPKGFAGLAASSWSQRSRFEQDLSAYTFEVASVEALRVKLEAAGAEAARAEAAGLWMPAYERVLDCLQLLDTLDARGDLLSSERERWHGECRRIAMLCAEGVELRRVESETNEASTAHDETLDLVEPNTGSDPTQAPAKPTGRHLPPGPGGGDPARAENLEDSDG